MADVTIRELRNKGGEVIEPISRDGSGESRHDPETPNLSGAIVAEEALNAGGTGGGRQVRVRREPV